MYQKTVKVINPSGLHARPAREFVEEAKKWSARITVARAGSDDRPVNAKSIVMLLSLAIVCGTEIAISAEGGDEQAAVEALAALTAGGFGEV